MYITEYLFISCCYAKFLVIKVAVYYTDLYGTWLQGDWHDSLLHPKYIMVRIDDASPKDNSTGPHTILLLLVGMLVANTGCLSQFSELVICDV